MDKIMRRVEKKTDDGWIEVRMQELTIGDVFRLFDPPNNTLVSWEGQSEWVANGEPYLNEDQVWTIMTDI